MFINLLLYQKVSILHFCFKYMYVRFVRNYPIKGNSRHVRSNRFLYPFLNISLDRCENTKVQYWNAQLKATVLEMIVVESRQSKNSRILSGITRVNPIRSVRWCDCVTTCCLYVLDSISPLFVFVCYTFRHSVIAFFAHLSVSRC